MMLENDTIIFWLIKKIIGVLKVCTTKNEETLSYRISTDNFNFDHFDKTSVYSHVNRDTYMKLYVKCCGGENGEPLE